MATTTAARTDHAVMERGPASSPLFEAFFEAVQQAGYPLTDDVNGYQQEGFARFDRNLHRGRRCSAAEAYLHPVKAPPEPGRGPAARRSTGSCSTAAAPSASRLRRASAAPRRRTCAPAR